jgi:hypothetical protein
MTRFGIVRFSSDFVPQGTEVVLQFGKSTSNVEFRNRWTKDKHAP